MIKYSESESVFAVATVINRLFFFFFHRAELLLRHTTHSSVNLIYLCKDDQSCSFEQLSGSECFELFFKGSSFQSLPDIPAHTTAICLTEVKESQQHTVVYTHTSINSHIVYAYTFQRALRSVSYGGVAQTSAWSQHSSGGGSLVMCVRFLTCCTDTDRTSRVSPEEHCRSTNTHTHKKKTDAQKPGECQKWHNENNECRLHTAKDGEGCLRPPGKQFFILLPGLHQ